MTFVDSSCLGRFLDSLTYTLFDGQTLKRYIVQDAIREGEAGHITHTSLARSGCLQVKAECWRHYILFEAHKVI